MDRTILNIELVAVNQKLAAVALGRSLPMRAIAVIGATLLAFGCATAPGGTAGGPITIERQGSFFVGGRQVTASGTYDPTQSQFPPGAGQTFWIDQMYVQYQIPLNPRKLPLVLVHGGGGSGRVWETTPDGREGFQTIFLRRGYPVYIVDVPRGSRSGYPSFTGTFGTLDEQQQILPAHTSRGGREYAWTRFRIGPKYPDVFSVQQFPMAGLDQFMMHVRPISGGPGEDPDVAAAALVALFERIGPAILVTHSNAGMFGWFAGIRSPNVKAIISYEPAVVFPRGEVPAAVPLFKGTQDAGVVVTAEEFSRLARRPVQVVYGDNIPTEPNPDLVADGRRAQVVSARDFVNALNREGGKASLLLLPEAGLRGNSHFSFSDLNNVQVADQLSAFLARNGLDDR